MNTKIIRKVAADLGEGETVVLWVAREFERTVKNAIEDGKYRAVLLPYLGKFAVKPARFLKFDYNGKVSAKIEADHGGLVLFDVQKRIRRGTSRKTPKELFNVSLKYPAEHAEPVEGLV